MVDALPGFLGSRCENLDRAFEWPGAVDESGQNDTWTDLRSRVDLLTQFRKLLDRISEITRSGHAGGNVEEGVLREQMRMRVPQAGQKHPTCAINDLRPWRHRLPLIGFNASNGLSSNRDSLVYQETAALGIENRDITDNQVPRGLHGQLFRKFRGSRGFHLSLRFAQDGNGGIKALPNYRRLSVSTGKESLLLIEP